MKPAIFLRPLALLALTLLLAGRAAGQEDAGAGPGRLVISGSESAAAPAIAIRAYGLDSAGQPLELTPQTVAVQHNQQEVTGVESGSPFAAGTFTLFLIDAPAGLEGQLPAVQAAIQGFSAPPSMQERLDTVTIYRVGAEEAIPALEPTGFYNAVLNFFAQPLETQAGPTALLDSLGRLLDEAPGLAPKPDIYTSLVVISDGTDAVSSEFQAEELG
ncbi:MAG: hypothetical protein ACRDHL_15360, partial [Candidatus Promineifilaceae bacterium]